MKKIILALLRLWRIVRNPLKNIFCVVLIFALPFIFPLITRFFIHINLFESINDFKEYISLFYSHNFVILFLIGAFIVYLVACKKDKLIQWLEKRDFSLKTKDVELSSKMAEMVKESSQKKEFITNLNQKEDDNKIVALSVQKELNLRNTNIKEKKKLKNDVVNIDDYNLLEYENNKLRFFSAYNIINQKTKELLHVIYCDKTMDLEYFKNAIINSFKARNKKNKNLSIAQKNQYANNKYETIKDGLQFLNIIEIADDNKIITLTSHGKTFVQRYIEKEVGEDE